VLATAAALALPAVVAAAAAGNAAPALLLCCLLLLLLNLRLQHFSIAQLLIRAQAGAHADNLPSRKCLGRQTLQEGQLVSCGCPHLFLLVLLQLMPGFVRHLAAAKVFVLLSHLIPLLAELCPICLAPMCVDEVQFSPQRHLCICCNWQRLVCKCPAASMTPQRSVHMAGEVDPLVAAAACM
jgi:hypothetical protein